MLGRVDDVAIGRMLRSIRVRPGLRQSDVARRAEVSQQLVSDLELGAVERVALSSTRRIARALGAEVVVSVRWRGADIDRLRDEGHATLVGEVARRLAAGGWLVATEVTYSRFGERGSYDLLAFHPERRTLLVVEVKTELVSAEETLRRLDAKVRLAPVVARERFGWDAAGVARLLAMEATSTNRRRVARHAPVFGRAFPCRGRDAAAFLRAPDGSAPSLLLFLSSTIGTGGIHRSSTVRRVRRARARSGRA